jgi:DNA-directed RNA polymerase subunit M/transcription elongation factor TFIIS
MAEQHEKDAMICRSCGNEERASEGYPCASCGTFVCVMCSIRGVLRCRNCANEQQPEPARPPTRREIPLIDWPEH